MIKTTTEWNPKFFMPQEEADEAKKAWEVIMTDLTQCLQDEPQKFNEIIRRLDSEVLPKKIMRNHSLVYPVTKAFIKAIEAKSMGVGKAKAPNLSFLDLSGIDLSCAVLPNADLSHAKIFGANFSGTNLSHVDFSYTHLSYTHLSYAHLYHTNFTHADIADTSFKGANLFSTIGLDSYLIKRKQKPKNKKGNENGQ
jgi:hypothetical protein